MSVWIKSKATQIVGAKEGEGKILQKAVMTKYLFNSIWSLS